MSTPHARLIPESVETLLNWKLPNGDIPFKDDKFLSGFKDHAKEANSLFDSAFAEISTVE